MKRGHSLDTIATMLLFLLFGISILWTLMLGVKSYQTVNHSLQESYQIRTTLQYITTKLHHVSGENSVSITTFGDGDAILLKETYDGEPYVTFLYFYDGMLMELFCAENIALNCEDGFSLLPIDDFSVEAIQDNLLKIACQYEGAEGSILVNLQGEVSS